MLFISKQSLTATRNHTLYRTDIPEVHTCFMPALFDLIRVSVQHYWEINVRNSFSTYNLTKWLSHTSRKHVGAQNYYWDNHMQGKYTDIKVSLLLHYCSGHFFIGAINIPCITHIQCFICQSPTRLFLRIKFYGCLVASIFNLLTTTLTLQQSQTSVAPT